VLCHTIVTHTVLQAGVLFNCHGKKISLYQLTKDSKLHTPRVFTYVFKLMVVSCVAILLYLKLHVLAIVVH